VQRGVDLVGRWVEQRPGLCREEAEAMAIKRRSSKVKSGIVPGPLTGQKTPRQIAKQCGIHPHSLELWKKESPGRVA